MYTLFQHLHISLYHYVARSQERDSPSVLIGKQKTSNFFAIFNNSVNNRVCSRDTAICVIGELIIFN